METLHLFEKKGAQKPKEKILYIMIKNNIDISYEYIKKNYNFKSIFIKETISILFEKQKLSNNEYVKQYRTADIIIEPNDKELKPYNNLKPLDAYKEKTGVYIFLDINNIPVYIGVAGEKNSKQHLRKRLEQHFNCNSGLTKTIIEIENLLKNKKFKKTEDRKILKKKLLEYCPKFLVIDCGNLNNDNVQESLDLEKCLIAIFNSKYNK